MSSASLLLANTASRLMFTQLPFLLIGNLIFATIEGLLIAYMLRAPKRRSIGLMIMANYASMLMGLILFGAAGATSLSQSLWPMTILNYPYWIAGAFAVSFAMSFLIELPFCHRVCVTGRQIGRSMFVCLFAQILSHMTCVAPYYWLYTEIIIPQYVTIDHSLSFILTDLPFWVYYIDPDSGDIYRMRPDGTRSELYIHEDLSKSASMWIGSSKPLETEDYDLYVSSAPSQPNRVVESSFAKRESAFSSTRDPYYPAAGSWIGNYAADLRKGHSGYWQSYTKYFAGIQFERYSTQRNIYEDIVDIEERFELRFTTAFNTWQGHNASILPGDIVIFEFGGQICALDLNTRKLGLIGLGYRPIVVRDEAESSPASEDAEDAGDQVEEDVPAEAAPGEDADRF